MYVFFGTFATQSFNGLPILVKYPNSGDKPQIKWARIYKLKASEYINTCLLKKENHSYEEYTFHPNLLIKGKGADTDQKNCFALFPVSAFSSSFTIACLGPKLSEDKARQLVDKAGWHCKAAGATGEWSSSSGLQVFQRLFFGLSPPSAHGHPPTHLLTSPPLFFSCKMLHLASWTT